MNELDLISLLERVKKELEDHDVFISTRERMHPCGLEMYEDIKKEVDEAIESYRKGQWRVMS